MRIGFACEDGAYAAAMRKANLVPTGFTFTGNHRWAPLPLARTCVYLHDAPHFP